MNRSVYEGKFLLNLVGGTLRQDESFPVMRNMNWARLYRIAEYHEITSAVYLGMLSVGARVPALFGERFFQRYQEAVHYGEIYEASELEIILQRVILWILGISRMNSIRALEKA